MTVIKYLKNKSHISEISSTHPEFKRLNRATIVHQHNRSWKNTSDGEISNQILVTFFGKTGYGKSSTVNALFGNYIMETSDVAACTRVCNSLDFELSPGHYLSLGDFPGIGESEYRDAEYLEMYKNFMQHASVVVYVIRADTRDYSIDERAYKELFPHEFDKRKIIIAMNYCDKIEPISRNEQKEPSPAQMEGLQKKITIIKKIFNSPSTIIPYSATTGWNIDRLAKEIATSIINSGELKLR